MTRPDFLIIGAMKCGTSTLAAQLAAQTGIFVTDPKEPNFFSDDAVFARGMRWYRALFDGAAPGDLTGEASTHYTKLPTHPETVARAGAAIIAPRLVYMVRDPVERAVSHYIHEWTMGRMTEPLERCLTLYPELVEYGRYGHQIAPWVDRFGAASICLISLEAMKAAPQETLARVCRHIGHDGPVQWKAELERVNRSADRVRRLPMHDVLVDGAVATALRRTLVPKGIRRAVRKRRQIPDRPALSAAQRARLERVFLQDRDVLAGHFPGSETLSRSYPFAPQ